MFYMTYARSRPNEIVPWAEQHNVPLLTNTIHRWSYNTDSFLDMWEYDTAHAIDAGGYNVQARYVDKHGNVTASDSELRSERKKRFPYYPFTVDEYDDWLTQHKDEIKWATVMDYACEDRFNELWSVEDRIEKTFEATLEHFEKEPDYTLLPVLQGRSIEQYVNFWQRLKDHGIPCEHVGLGTVCRLSGETEIVRYEKEIREQTDIENLHGFGVKIEAYKHGAAFDSADSQAWAWAPSNGFMYTDEKTRLGRIDMPDDSLRRTVGSFKHYYCYVKRLMNEPVDMEPDTEIVSNQRTLGSFSDPATATDGGKP